MLLRGRLVVVQGYCLGPATTGRLEERGGSAFDVYQSGGHHPFYIFPYGTCEREHTAAGL